MKIAHKAFSGWLQERLMQAGVTEAAAEARWILEELGFNRLTLLMQPEHEVAEIHLQRCREIAARRQRHEPLQHILGYQWFRGLRLQVSPEVLIPRPETEELVEWALPYAHTRAADIGTGSGAIALSLAQARPTLQIVATDLSAAALALAQSNARQLGLNQIDWRQGDGLHPLLGEAPFDLLISNPPYIPAGDIAGLSPEVRDHEPRMALTPGPDALHFYRLFAQQAPGLLKPGGWLWAELDAGMAEASAALFHAPGWQSVRLERDAQGLLRFLGAQRSD